MFSLKSLNVTCQSSSVKKTFLSKFYDMDYECLREMLIGIRTMSLHRSSEVSLLNKCSTVGKAIGESSDWSQSLILNRFRFLKTLLHALCWVEECLIRIKLNDLGHVAIVNKPSDYTRTVLHIRVNCIKEFTISLV